ncbi:MAG: hypothetical protein KatS3mg115_0980 [Candidatus Poribacteria bacterium]|nr:MAG: hypothetical protein KatS3mg115_0980 [Candidatus Poribacteria bacterium]
MEYRLPILLPTPTEELTARFRERGVPVSDQLVERIRSGPLPTLDALNTGCASDDWETAQKAYRSAVRNLKPGVTQIILHLGKGGEEMRAITNSWRSRQNDLKVVSDPDFRKLLQEERDPSDRLAQSAAVSRGTVAIAAAEADTPEYERIWQLRAKR